MTLLEQTTAVENRRFPRCRAGWATRYMVEDRPRDGWHECGVLDLSLGGVGLELFGPSPRLGAGIRVELRLAGDSAAALHLRGRLRNLSPGAGGGPRAGVEWTYLSAVPSGGSSGCCWTSSPRSPDPSRSPG
jgi:hypothetical protein